jgi:NosR/NirI family nitrous oxide reductase transcriptional regulator
MPLLRWVLLILGLGAFLFVGVHRHLTRGEPFVPGAEVLRAVSPDVPPLARHEGPNGFYFRDSEGGGARAVAFVSDQVDPEVRGYAGEISLIVGLDKSGVVTGVRLLGHEETPSYMKTVVNSGFLERLAGRKLGAELAGLDAVTGATITSNAIREDVLQGGALLARHSFGLDVEGVSRPPGFLASLRDTHSLVILGAMGIALAAFFSRSFRAGRALSLAAGLIALGLYNNIPLSTAHFTNLASLKTPSPSNAPLILVLGFVFVTGILFRSRVYCDYLCPFAAVQEALFALSKRKTKVSERVWRLGAMTRHILLFAIAILVSVGGYHAIGAMEPYVFLFNPEAHVLPWIYVGAVVVAAFFVKRFWCRIFCPCGACVELVASVRGRRAPRRGTGGRR